MNLLCQGLVKCQDAWLMCHCEAQLPPHGKGSMGYHSQVRGSREDQQQGRREEHAVLRLHLLHRVQTSHHSP